MGTSSDATRPISRPPVPVWSIPLLLVLLGIVLFLGNLSATMSWIVGAEVVLVCVFLLWRSRQTPPSQRPVFNALALFPGHLLLLLGISLLATPDGLAALWTAIPLLSIAYDRASAGMQAGRARRSILIGQYAILWAVLFALLDRLIVLSRGLDGRGEIIVAAAIGVFGLTFLTLGIYRHVRAGKE